MRPIGRYSISNSLLRRPKPTFQRLDCWDQQMPSLAAIYGHAITKPIDLLIAQIEPIYTDSSIHSRARDQSKFQLTAVLRGEKLEPQLIFNLEAILAFIERLDVLIDSPVDIKSPETPPDFPSILSTHSRNSGGGAILPEDTWSPSSRGEFVRKALARLTDEAYCKETGFNTLFFKYVEAFRQRKPFIEVSWFLLYSGLEAFARSTQNDHASRNSSEPIYRLLKSYNFQVYQDSSKHLHRSISTYTQLRNSLFHHGARETLVNLNGELVKLEMTNFHFNFEQLVALVILKAIDFDDGHINWDSWTDRQPFK
jgi:hypothetical protein